jgi:hypothetical protein
MQESMGLPQFSQVTSSLVVPAILDDVHAGKLIILLFIYLTVTDFARLRGKSGSALLCSAR